MKPETYKYVPVYLESHAYACYRPHLYFNKGEAGPDAIEYQLAYTGDLAQVMDFDLCRIVYRTSNAYYLTKHEAAIALGIDECCPIWEAELVRPYLEPVKLPVTAQLVLGERGLYTHLNLHPEIDGRYAKGKIYFPDRSCADSLAPGDVIITEVKDKGSYGFFKGYNVQYEWPADFEVDTYIHNDVCMWNDVLLYIETAHFGNFILIGTCFDGRRFESCGYAVRSGIGVRDGEVVKIRDYDRLEQDKVREAKRVTVADFVCQRYHDCSFSDLLKKFVEVPQASELVKWGHYSDKYVSGLMDEASDSSIVRPMASEQGVFFYEIGPAGMVSGLSCFSREEMDEIIKTANQVNMAATEQIRSLVKRGKMRIT